MISKHITGDCTSCESSFDLVFMEELVSEEIPQFCPFCGEALENVNEEVEEDEDEEEDEDDLDTERHFGRSW